MMTALRRNKKAFQFAPESLRRNTKFMQGAMRILGWQEVLPGAPKELRGDSEFMVEAASQDVEALQFASEDFCFGSPLLLTHSA